MLATNTTANERYASHADGTWMYRSLAAFPCCASGGETTSDMTALAAMATSVAQPRMRSPRGAVIRPATRSSELTMRSSSLLQEETEHQGTDRDEHQIEREEQAQPRARLAGPPGGGEGGRPHAGDQHGRRERQDEQRKDCLARPRRFGEHAEEAPHGGETDRSQEQRRHERERRHGERQIEQARDQQHDSKLQREQLD